MARDYKARAVSHQNSGRRGPCLFWFVAGGLVGAFAVGVLWLQQGGPVRQEVPKNTPRSVQERPPKPKFDFYNLLPEMELVVPDEEVRAPPPVPYQAAREPQPAAVPAKPSPAPKKTRPKPVSGTTYLVQVASLRKAADAERLKAKLALLGLQARIQRVTVNNKDTFHRVRTGPYRSQEELNTTRALLKQNGLESVVIKLK